MPSKWLYWTLPIVATGVLAASLLGTETPALEGEHAQMVETSDSEEAAFHTRAATVEQESAEANLALFPVPVVPSRNFQARVNERRDLSRERGHARLDAFGNRNVNVPPWISAYGGTVEPYRDAMRFPYRRPRDYAMQRRDNWMEAVCPWSKPPRDRSHRRGIWMPTEQFYPQGIDDAWFYGRPYGVTGPAPW